MAKKTSTPPSDPKSIEAQIIQAVTNYKNEADEACRDRMLQNQDNFDTYHLKQNFEHKQKGQSKEFLAKQFMAVEQLCSFVKQGLIDLGNEWYSIEYSDGVESSKITKDSIKKLLDRQLEKNNFYNVFEAVLKSGLLGSLMICKVHGKWVAKPKYMAVKPKAAKPQVMKDIGFGVKQSTTLMRTSDKVWQLALDCISPIDFRPDPAGRELYNLNDIEMDLHEVRKLVKSDQNPDGIYDAEAVSMLASDIADLEKDFRRSRESGQDVSYQSYRKRVIITECWGTIIDADGNVLFENVVCAVANGKFLIRKPEANPFWHQEVPIVDAPVVRVPNSRWHKALMDAPTKHNRAMNEIYNLMLDSGIMSVFGVRQLRTDWLQDATLVDDGIFPGQTLEVNSQCPPGAKVLERVDTTTMSAEATAIYNLTNAEFQQSALTNDLRLGVLPSRQVKATEIVESSQSITGMLNGVARSIECDFLVRVLKLSWMNCCQHLDDFDDTEVQKLLGPQIAAQIKALSPAERFAETVNGLTFEVFGITNTLNKQKDFRRLTALLQTIAGNQILTEAFAQEYSFNKFLGEIVKALDINEEKIKLSPEEKAQHDAAVSSGAPGAGAAPTGAAGSGSSPNLQSQIPQVASENAGSIANVHFPPSRALHGLVNGPKQ